MKSSKGIHVLYSTATRRMSCSRPRSWLVSMLVHLLVLAATDKATRMPLELFIPVVTLTDRTLWKTMHKGMIRHGIAEIVKMAVVENKPLFELLEKVGPQYLVKTKFG